MVGKNGTSVAIVGAGASGVACLIQLVIKHIVFRKTSPLLISLFEKKEEFGPGLAYGTGQEGHLLNTRAGLMGILPEEPLHFVQWAHQHKEVIERKYGLCNIHPDTYPPRRLYGDYVRAMLEHYCHEADRFNVVVKRERADVIGATIDKKGQIMLATRDRRHRADYTILATGNPMSNNFRHLERYQGYIPSPWPSTRILDVVRDKEAEVAIVGSSLTAIDAMITLVDNGHRGKIVFFSTEGLLPTVQPPVERSYQRKVLTISVIRRLMREQQRTIRIKDLIRLYRAEVEQFVQHPVDWTAEVRAGKDHLALLTSDIRDALSGGSIFQDILYSLRYESYPIWQLLPVDQKQLFGKWIKTEVDINRHAIPLRNGLKLKKLLESGQLRVIGQSKDIHQDDTGFELKTEDGQTYRADFVINATGPATSIQQMNDQPLLQQLLASGCIQEYGAGGLVVDLNTMRVLASRSGPSPFYAVGHPLIGLQHDVNALWFNVAQADKLTTDLIQRLP